MDRVVEVARECGYLDGVPEFRPPDAYGYFPRDKVVALLTGSQGEPRAALARIADDEHPDVALSPGDRVIFSSRTIPGNEKAVGTIINSLLRRGIEVITDRTELVHVSGHPRRDELAAMYRWTRPRIAIPAHGEDLHLAEHAAFARAQGVQEVVRARNGTVVRLAPGPAAIIDEVPVGRLYKDGDIVVGAAERAMPERRKLSFAGIVSVAIAIDERGELAGDPVIEVMGLPAKTRRGDSIPDLVADAVGDVLDGLPRARRRDPGGGRAGGGARRPQHRATGLGQEARLPCPRRRGMKRLHGSSDRHDRPPEPRRHRRDGSRRGRRASIATRSGPRCRRRSPLPEHGVTVVFVDSAEHQDRASRAARGRSPIRPFLERNPNGGIHHVCYEVDDIVAARDRLVAAGARARLGEPTIGAHGKPVLFLHPKDFCGTLVELEQA